MLERLERLRKGGATGAASTTTSQPARSLRAAAGLLLEVMEDPDPQARYLKYVLPLVAYVQMGR